MRVIVSSPNQISGLASYGSRLATNYNSVDSKSTVVFASKNYDSIHYRGMIVKCRVCFSWDEA
jgi:hypothetical protein